MNAESEAEPCLSNDDELSVPADFDPLQVLREVSAQLDNGGPIRPQVEIDDAVQRLPKELPAQGCEASVLGAEMVELAAAFSRRNSQPGFMGFICSPGLPTDPLAHAVKALLNQNVSGFVSAPGAAAIEQKVVSWFTELCGFGLDGGGAFVAGGSMGNFTGLACALYRKLGDDALEHGIGGRPLVIYCSREAHFSVERAVRILGLGSGALRKVRTDAAFRMDPEQLEAAIKSDLERGNLPCAIVATVGTTVTGSIDPLDAITQIAQRHELWLHIDAAYGGAALLAPKLRTRLGDFSKADSIAIDLHKWLYVALDAGMLLLRDPSHAERVFAFHAEYVDPNPALASNPPTFLCRGLEASRPFRALAPYWALRQYGSRRLGNNMQFNAECARYLADRVRATPRLQLINVPELSICCFRYQDERFSSARIDSINERIRAALEAEGRNYLSPTRIEGRPVLRVCLVSSATRPPQLRDLIQRVVELGAQFATQSSSGQAG